jgi:hypothetical protein
MVEGEIQMPGKNKEAVPTGEEPIVIIIGKKNCPPETEGWI